MAAPSRSGMDLAGVAEPLSHAVTRCTGCPPGTNPPNQPGKAEAVQMNAAGPQAPGRLLFKPKDWVVAGTEEDKLAMDQLGLEEGSMELWASPGAEDTENGSRGLFPIFPRRWQDLGHQGSGLYSLRSPTDLLLPSPCILLLWGQGLPAGHCTLPSQLHWNLLTPLYFIHVLLFYYFFKHTWHFFTTVSIDLHSFHGDEHHRGAYK